MWLRGRFKPRSMRQQTQPFDLSADLPIRAKLLRLGADEHILLITMHHIASDGWSMSLLFKELTAVYNSRVAGEEPIDLPELPIQYADYALWQQDWLSGETLDKQLAFWLEQLAEAPTTLDLTD